MEVLRCHAVYSCSSKVEYSPSYGVGFNVHVTEGSQNEAISSVTFSAA